MSSQSKTPDRVRIRIFDLTWALLPLGLFAALDFAFRAYGPDIQNKDLHLLSFEALLFLLVGGFVLLGRKCAVAGWRRPKGLSWLWVAGPLRLGVVSPFALAFENVQASPGKLAVWTAAALFVALNEETLFRGFTLRGMLRSFRPMTAVIVSSVMFGLLHILNLFEGGDPVFIGAQMISAMGVGSILAAMALRCGSIWPAVLLHFLGDTVGLAALGGYAGAIQSAELAPSMAITGLVFLAWGLFWSWRAAHADKVYL